MLVVSWLRLARTVRHLRWEQILGQVQLRLRPRWERPAQLRNQTPSLEQWRFGEASSRDSLTGLRSPVPAQSAESLQQREFRFIGIAHRFLNEVDWNVADLPLLWRYNLHYFDWLWSYQLEDPAQRNCFVQSIDDWIQQHPLGTGQVGWAPYPTSLRLMNWSLRLAQWPQRESLDPIFAERLRVSCWHQAQWLERHLEYHLLANHLLENAVALVVLGKLWAGTDAERWLALGTQILDRELPEQFLQDGSHFERSPMYHQRCTWLLEVLQAVGWTEGKVDGEAYLQRAQQSMAKLLHPDESIALLNDAAIGIYETSSVAKGARANLNGPWSLPEAGYYGASRSDEYLVVDAGAIGPDYQPGHAHADYLSLEWTVAGKRFLTDTGIHDYATSPERRYDRSTAAHNSITINDMDSCEVWGAFRVGRRVHPTLLTWREQEDELDLEASHRGFPGFEHVRQIRWRPGFLDVHDRVQGAKTAHLCGRWHVAPGWRCELEAGGIRCEQGSTRIRVSITGNGVLDLTTSRYSPHFGTKQERPMIRYQATSSEANWIWRFTLESVRED